MHDQWTGSELDSLIGRTALTRRELIVTSLAAGFAAAVSPVRADTLITTDTEGLTAGEVGIPVTGGEVPAYRAMPAKGGRFPLVLVVQEIFGVHEHIKDMCRRFAKEGYLAIAPELYARQGDVSKIDDWKQIYAEVVSKVPDAQVMSDLDAAVAWAGQSGSGDTARARRHRLLLGRADRLVVRRAQFDAQGRGRLVRTADRRSDPVAAELSAGRRDGTQGAGARPLRWPGPGHPARPTSRRCERRSPRRRSPSEIVVFPDAAHGFHADYRPSYRAEDAKEGWRRCLAWFRKYGVG